MSGGTDPLRIDPVDCYYMVIEKGGVWKTVFPSSWYTCQETLCPRISRQIREGKRPMPALTWNVMVIFDRLIKE
jgi:hypothetical protein